MQKVHQSADLFQPEQITNLLIGNEIIGFVQGSDNYFTGNTPYFPAQTFGNKNAAIDYVVNCYENHRLKYAVVETIQNQLSLF